MGWRRGRVENNCCVALKWKLNDQEGYTCTPKHALADGVGRWWFIEGREEIAVRGWLVFGVKGEGREVNWISFWG